MIRKLKHCLPTTTPYWLSTERGKNNSNKPVAATASAAAVTTTTTTTTTVTTTTHCDSGQQSFGHVGNNDTNEEDDCVKPVIVEDEGNDEEWHAEEDCDGRDDVDEMCYLTCYWGLADLQPTRQVGNTTHHRTITRVDYQTTRCAYKTT